MNRPLPDLAQQRARRNMINATWNECRTLFQSNIFTAEGSESPLFQSCVVHLLICLNDLLQKAKDDGHRVAFADNVNLANGVTDVTDLISKCRNAACHIGSPHAEFEFGIFRFNVAVDRGARLQINDVFVGENEFDDDIAVFYGDFRLYLRRHAHRAFEEVGRALDANALR